MVLCQKRTTPHPRDGPWAWLVCFSGSLINAFGFGILLSFGVLLPVLSEEFKMGRGAIAWIGSLGIGFAFLCFPISLKIVTMFGERLVGLCGGFAAATLMVASSFVQHIEILYFTHGILLGFCINCIVSAFSKSFQKYFKKHIGLASGISTSGASLGILVLVPALQALVELLGWRGSLRVMSGAMVLIGIACLSFDPNVEEEYKDSKEEQSKTTWSELYDCSIWTNPKYTIGTISLFLTWLGLYVPMLHMISFAHDRNIPASKSSQLFIYSGVCSTVFRIAIGKVVDKRWLTPLQCIQLSSFIVGLSLFLFTQAKVYSHFVLFIICYGIGNGIYISTQYTFLLTCFTDARRNYVGLSMCYAVSSFALFLGSPIAGFLADQFNSYVPAFFIFGSLMIFSGALPFCLLLRKEPDAEIETRLKLIGSRLANVESSLRINM